jgi:hypothetical protein
MSQHCRCSLSGVRAVGILRTRPVLVAMEMQRPRRHRSSSLLAARALARWRRRSSSKSSRPYSRRPACKCIPPRRRSLHRARAPSDARNCRPWAHAVAPLPSLLAPPSPPGSLPPLASRTFRLQVPSTFTSLSPPPSPRPPLSNSSSLRSDAPRLVHPSSAYAFACAWSRRSTPRGYMLSMLDAQHTPPLPRRQICMDGTETTAPLAFSSLAGQQNSVACS